MAGRAAKGIYCTLAWARMRRRALDRDGWRCVLCGEPGRLEVDHIQPIAEGGAALALDNLRTLCRGCHVAVTATANRRAVPAEIEKWNELVERT